jgi:hypothetical protein
VGIAWALGRTSDCVCVWALVLVLAHCILPQWQQSGRVSIDSLNFAGGGGIGISVLFPSQAILKPFIYLTSTPGKDVRTKLIQAFKLQPLAQRPYRQTWAHLQSRQHAAFCESDVR